MDIGIIENNAWIGLIAVIAYFLGSIPSAYLGTKAIAGKDIRKGGSGNIGAMNSYRIVREATGSRRLAVAGLIGMASADMGKAILAVHIARWLAFLGYDLSIALIVTSAFVVAGHNFPVYVHFRQGGRGIAAFMGLLIALNGPAIGIWCTSIAVCIIIAHATLTRLGKMEPGQTPIHIMGTQIVGRVVGMWVGLVPLYFFDPTILFPALAGMALIHVKHVDRLKSYIKELPNRQTASDIVYPPSTQPR